MSRKLEYAIVEGEVHASQARLDKLRELFADLSPKVNQFGRHFTKGRNNCDHAIVQVSYGPVLGGWPSDVRKKLREAAVRVDTNAQFDLTGLRRTVVSRRA